MPKNVTTTFQTWFNSNPTLRIELAERVRAALPVSRESLIFMLQRKCLEVRGGLIYTGPNKPKKASKKIIEVDEIKWAVQAAAMLGRLLARAGTTTTIYTTIGLAP
jgi:hypothetical protein